MDSFDLILDGAEADLRDLRPHTRPSRFAPTRWSMRYRTMSKVFTILTYMALTVVFYLLYSCYSAHASLTARLDLAGTSSSFVKPEDVHVHGVVFYGRRETVEVLNCYLQKNLVANGGWLEDVRFVVNTDRDEDLDWISRTTKAIPGYTMVHLEAGTDHHDYERLWREAIHQKERYKHIYIKFDDDLVWLSNTAVEEMVTSLYNHDEAFAVLGNLINSAALGFMHLHQGAIHGFLPEVLPPTDPHPMAYGPQAWRISALPAYTIPEGQDKIQAFPDTRKSFDGDRTAIGDVGGPPYFNHRWLPVPDTALPLTPMWRTEYHPNSADWRGWQLGAQQHYSLLQNLEHDDGLVAYHFGDKEGLWNMHYMHANINLMAVWADDILDNLPFDVREDDEAHFTVHLPQKLKKQVYVQTRAIASHFSFGTQREMYDTDLLGRYRAFANEQVCGRQDQVPVASVDGEGKAEW